MLNMKRAAASAVLVLLTAGCTITWNHPNVVLLDGPTTMGSGVVIADGWILTVKHILPITTADGMDCGEAIPHPTLDLALIPCPEAEASGLRPALTGPKVFERLYAYGWHQAVELLKTEGYQGHTLGQMSAPIIFGCSGGAVVNARGELVGIISHVSFQAITEGWGYYALSHMAGYIPIDADVLDWIGKNT